MKLKVLLYYLFFVGCNNPTGIENSYLELSIDLNLNQDRNGFYILPLDTSSIQTIHVIEGAVYPPQFYKRVEWTTDLYWEVNDYKFKPVNPVTYSKQDGTFGNVLGPVVYMRGDTMKVSLRWDPKDLMDSYYDFNPTEEQHFYIILQ